MVVKLFVHGIVIFFLPVEIHSDGLIPDKLFTFI